MKLTSLQMTDVLSHVSADVKLGEHLTVFTGVSESGKSAIMRGFDQCLRNRPAGIDLLRHGAKRGSCSEFAVGLTDDAGKARRIVRRRGKSKNEYEVDGQPLLAIGRDVPEEVSSILKLSPHAFQLQSDGNFLLSQTDGEVAKALSGTVGLAQIDAAFTAVNKRKTENDTALRVSQADVERERESAAKYAGLDAADAALCEAERLEGELAHLDEGMACSAALADSLVGLRPDLTFKLGQAQCELTTAVGRATLLDLLKKLAADGEQILATLERIPASVDANSARCCVLDLEGCDTLADEAAVCRAGMQYLMQKLEGLPRDAAMMPRRAAMLLTQGKTAHENWSATQTAANDMAMLLAKLDSAAQEKVNDLVACAQAVNNAAFFSESLAVKERVFADMDGLLGRLEAVERDAARSALILKGIEQEIERYMSEHPVCPECGAEQIHWHVKKGE